ncbi:MAG: penicillin-binding transpeptidase domain-containing protein [Dehalococcoidia bacterium]|nr:penicillin-binding transpeptidase domain-containing protein [Dehalococcoidia bacterium]
MRKRVYRDATLSHVLGYLSAEYGSQGAELAFNDLLVGREGRSWKAPSTPSSTATPDPGRTSASPSTPRSRRAAANGLGGRAGAVVALNPQNGQVLAMTSFPTYDPGSINQNGDALFDNPNAPVLNRATQGLYPPGSTFKTVTTSGILEHDILDLDTTVDLPGGLRRRRLPRRLRCSWNWHVPVH